jgi:hypothetical protein
MPRKIRELITDLEAAGFTNRGHLYPTKELVSPFIMQKPFTKREFLLMCGISEEHLPLINLNKYTRQGWFDDVLRKCQPKAKPGST